MEVKQIKQDGLSYEYEVKVDAKDLQAKQDEKLKELAKGMRVPGFRPGKAPLSLMKQRYGKAVLGEVLESAVNESSVEAIKQEGLKPAFQPKIEVKSFDEGEDLIYTMNLDVLPDFDIMDLKKLKLEKPVAEPTDEAVAEALERLASNMTSTQKISSDRKTKNDDIVLIDFDGRTADDDVKQPGMAAEGHQLKLGSGQFIPGFEEQLVGKKAGDDVEVKVSFPDDYGAKELAGREAIFDVKIHEIHEEAPAEINDEMAQKLGLENADALKDAAKGELEKEYANHSNMKVKRQLLDQLDDGHDFDVPPQMLEMEFNGIIQQIEHQAKSQGEEGEISEDDKEDYKLIAERRVRLGLVLAEIGNKNEIQVNDQDLQRAVIQEAQRYPGQEKEVFDYYSKNQEALNSLRAPLFEDKVVDFILEQVDVKENKVSAEELTKEEEEFELPKKDKKKSTAKKSSAKKSASKKGDKKEEKSDDKKEAKKDDKPAANKKKAAPKKKKAE